MLEFSRRKELRSEIILEYMKKAGYKGAVIFSCGNASRELKKQADNKFTIVEVSPNGDLTANRWWKPEEIKKAWPDYFDATSGHLPLFLMVRIAARLKKFPEYWLGCKMELGRPYSIPTGSGETILCLQYAFPEMIFVPVYNISRGTKFEPEAPLNNLIDGGIG